MCPRISTRSYSSAHGFRQRNAYDAIQSQSIWRDFRRADTSAGARKYISRLSATPTAKVGIEPVVPSLGLVSASRPVGQNTHHRFNLALGTGDLRRRSGGGRRERHRGRRDLWHRCSDSPVKGPCRAMRMMSKCPPSITNSRAQSSTMNNLSSETLIPIHEAPRHLPKRPNGKRIHISACYRQISRGVRGVRLESIKLGGSIYASTEALQRSEVCCDER